VKVEVHRTGSQRILQRMMQELQANIRNVDVVHTSDAGHYVLLVYRVTEPCRKNFPADRTVPRQPSANKRVSRTCGS